MQKRYYFDTSIWLDFFEDRNEPNLAKSDLVRNLINKIIKNNDKIIYSDVNIIEFGALGYSLYEINDLLKELKEILIFVEAGEREIGKSKDLSLKRNIPKRDALHAIIARNNKAVLVTLDKHLQKTLDIIKPKRPQDLI